MNRKDSRKKPGLNGYTLIFGQSLIDPKPLRIATWKRHKKNPVSRNEVNHRRFKQY